MHRGTLQIETENGRLRGLRHGGTCSFRGIPYAAGTGGRNRFLAPRPVAHWTGVRDAFTHGDRCPQTIESISRFPVFSWYGQEGAFSEDCCVLNVFTPADHPDVPRPVIFYIHGGGYASGSSNGPALDGSTLASFGDVVVVTVNHRLNVFGYLNIGESANVGQLDLVAALQWIQRNISAFGGDPANVTLLGQSGGGNKAMVLLTMPKARGLFRRAINMSGASGLHLARPEETRPYVDALFDALGVTMGDLRTLQHLPVEMLQMARNAAMVAVRNDGSQPVVDGREVLASPFAPEGLALHASMPLMIGSTGTEATLFLGGDMRSFVVNEAQLKMRVQSQFGLDAVACTRLIAAYRADDPSRSATDVLCRLASDILSRGPLIRAAEAKARVASAPVYLYNFAWNIPGEHAAWRSPHAVDIPFAFGTVECARGMTGPGPGPVEVARNLMTAFASFARSGDPNNGRMPAWQPYDTASRATMVIDERCRLVNDFQGAGRKASEPLRTSVQPTTLLRGPLFRPLS